MAYTTINKSTDHFNTKLYTGNGSTNAQTGVGFQPDWVWIKDRDATHDHYSFDAVRTNKKGLEPSDTAAERTPILGSLDSDGFTFASTDGFYNANGDRYVSWNWKAGGGAGSSNTDGSINTIYTSVNTTAGFSMSTYTGTGSAATVGHGLGVAPKVVLIKRTSTTGNWVFGHGSLGFTKFLEFTNGAVQTHSGRFNDTAPTSSVFLLEQHQRLIQVELLLLLTALQKKLVIASLEATQEMEILMDHLFIQDLNQL